MMNLRSRIISNTTLCLLSLACLICISLVKLPLEVTRLISLLCYVLAKVKKNEHSESLFLVMCNPPMNEP